MENKGLEKLKKEYMETPIPKELDLLVEKTLKDSKV
ncbi:MAG TPA: anti-sigma factor, partial [Clostridiaceae bacterium]|nr:anti-sigma factor [Clostridiaceae bacterium]